ncbi:MAG: penicillin-binding protein [Treponema sp.]
MEINNFISKKRFIFFVVLLSIITSVLMIKYAKQMLLVKADVASVARTQERGTIVDRNGKILAAATTLYNASVNTSLISDVPGFSEILAPLIDIPAEKIADKIMSSPSHFLYLKKKMSESEKDLLQDAIKLHGLKGIRFEAVSNRTYPENILASTVIGYLGDDGKGLAGIEYSMQHILSPAQGTTAGYTVFLTIDSAIQYMLQQLAEKAMQDTQAEAVILLAADAKTGELLAYVNEPSADLAHFSESTEAQRFDRPAYFMYEPGSVFKIFSLASFLDMGVTKDSDEYICRAKFVFIPQINNANQTQNTLRCLRAHGRVTPRDIIRFSCNDGIAQIADKADPALFAEKLKAFGFGSKTGIELPGEATGLFAPATSWSARTKHTISIGQEIAVTSLQIMQAATAFTNGGKTIKLSLLSEVRDSTGACVYRHTKKTGQYAVSPEVARLVLDYMRTAADEGTGAKASINGVPIAVKTGTAQMAHKTGKGYSQTDYLSSCIGIFPVDDPKIIVYTAIIRPVGETYGSIIAAPIISAAANAIIDYYGMERSNAPNIVHSGRIQRHGAVPVEIQATMPDLTGVPKKLLLNLLTRSDIMVQLKGDGYVVSQIPAAGTPITKGMTIELTLN